MEFIVSRNKLLRALQHVRCAITKQNIPVFNCFVFSFDGKTMTVHASNGSLWMKETIALDDEPVKPRPVAIWYSDLLRPVKSIDEQPLRFEVLEYQVIIHHAIGSFRLPLYQYVSEFFDFKAPAPYTEADDGYQLEYEAPCLKSVLSRCAFAMSQDELRPVMNDVYFNLTDKFCDYVSSDGHKLVRVRKSRSADSNFIVNDLSFIIPYNVVKVLLKVMPSTGNATLQYQKELTKKGRTERKPQCRVIINDNLTLSFNTVEGPYPKYWNVIPNSHNFKMTIDRKALIKSCDRLSLFASTTNLVKMTIDKTTLKIEAGDFDSSLAGDETLPCECEPFDGHSPINLRIGMKAVLVSQMLKTLSTEKAVFLLTDSSRAAVIQPQPQPDSENITMIFLPMLIQD